MSSSEAPVALITGGARGIGRGIATMLVAEGWRVAVCYRTSQADAESLVAEAGAAGGEAAAERCDVSDPDAAAALVASTAARWGRLDAVVNAAGPYHRAKLLTAETPEGWRGMFANNLDPVFFTARAAAPHLRASPRGRILAFSMASAEHVVANTAVTAHYIAKLGVQALIRALAKELARDGVTANCISPGFVDSQSAPPDELERMRKKIPARRIGSVADVVGAARYLLSAEAAYVTGANVVVAGGWGL